MGVGVECKTMYECDRCGELHETEDGANECCHPKVRMVYLCSICEEQFDERDRAEQCCSDQKHPGQTPEELEAARQIRLIQ